MELKEFRLRCLEMAREDTDGAQDILATASLYLRFLEGGIAVQPQQPAPPTARAQAPAPAKKEKS